MLPPFLTRPVRRLRADGRLEALALREPALGRPRVLLARSLCRFDRFEAPGGLSRRAALAAARLHARTRAPFATAAFALARRGHAFGVWWWDRAQAEAALAAAAVEEPVRFLPEAAGQAAAEGWRVLRLPDGVEAQHWRNGFLEASAWRRAPFDLAAWSALTRLAGDGEGVAVPPPPQPPLFVASPPYGARFVTEVDVGATAPAVATAALIVSLGLSAFFVGQGLGVARRDAALREEIARREAAPTRSRRPELLARARRLDALAAVVDAPGPLERLAEAQRRLARFGLKVEAFDARADALSVSVPASAAPGVDLLVEDLQRSPSFTDVRPTLDRETRRLTLRMAVRGAAASSAAAKGAGVKPAT